MVCLQQTTDSEYYIVLEDRTLKDIKMPRVQWKEMTREFVHFCIDHRSGRYKCKATKQDRKYYTDLPLESFFLKINFFNSKPPNLNFKETLKKPLILNNKLDFASINLKGHSSTWRTHLLKR